MRGNNDPPNYVINMRHLLVSQVASTHITRELLHLYAETIVFLVCTLIIHSAFFFCESSLMSC